MRTIITYMILAFLTALALFFMAPKAHAQEIAGPSSCLVVVNEETHGVDVRLNYPTNYPGIVWTLTPGPHVLVYRDVNGSDRIVTSPTGKWDINVKGFDGDLSGATWHYDANRNTAMGCNGSWVVTIP
jgi:hypothetical protein